MFGFFHVFFLKQDLQFSEEEVHRAEVWSPHFIMIGIILHSLSLVRLKFVLTETLFARELH